ncbi:MAG: acetyltransferase [Bacteroidia bacterium]
MDRVVIFGVGQGASIAFRYLKHDSNFEVVGFTLHSKYIKETEYMGLPVVPFEEVEQKFSPDKYKMFAPLGFDDMNRFRQGIYEQGKQKGYKFISYIHSSNKTLEPLVIGENCMILENQSLNLDIKIGNNVVMWSGNQIGDRAIIEDHVWISSHVCVSGDVHIKQNCILAVNCTISNNVVVAEETFVGANALIAKNTAPKEVYLVPPTQKGPFTSDRFIKMIKK